MITKKHLEVKLVFGLVLALFLLFLLLPMASLLLQSFSATGVTIFDHYIGMLMQKGFLEALANSFLIATVSSLLTTTVAFLLAYTIHYTNVNGGIKKVLKACVMFPMLIPTITYGFAIIYSLGKQGLITKLFGFQLLEIYGFQGLLLGYFLYTLPVSFLLLSNTMKYVDKKFSIVSRTMGDRGIQTFWMTVLRPLLGTFATSFVQCFALTFTDYGIPASVGGEFEVVASVLYNEMLGSVPSFENGAVVAVFMLIPSVLSFALLRYLEKYNIRYKKISTIDIARNRTRDFIFGCFSILVSLVVVAVFLVIFVVIFLEEWPYKLGFTFDNIMSVFGDSALIGVYQNSLWMSILTALFGTLLAFGASIVSVRSHMPNWCKRTIEALALVTNTIPGMVIGIAFLFVFTGTPLQNTLAILVLCNIVHFFQLHFLC